MEKIATCFVNISQLFIIYNIRVHKQFFTLGTVRHQYCVKLALEIIIS